MLRRIREVIRKYRLRRKLKKVEVKYGYDYFLKSYPEPLTEQYIAVTLVKHSIILSRVLGVNVEVNKKVLNAILSNFHRYGLPFCACKLSRDRNNICPCKDHVKELIERGRCKCGLYYISTRW